ncbi:MAG: YedE family putative selenium transporter [Clostridium sp.]|uniref:YedE family putative selenium transporter n=1 Tax=Clostridium sp. TaxID=1506 RepID=UPI002FC5C5F0
MMNKKLMILAGGLIGLISVLLVYFGNPGNMGACIACFVRDIAGALGLHRAPIVQYIRPEIIGIVLGAFVMAVAKKEFDVRGGSSPFIRFLLGVVVMIGALVFLGCPLRMILRLAGGDMNALFGIVGFAAGILVGIPVLNKGFSLKRNYKLAKVEGYLFPIINIGLLALLIVAPAFIFFSKKGPGSMHAAVAISLAAGAIIGIIAQRSRLCMVGGIRDAVMFKDFYLLSGFIAIFVVGTIANLVFGFYKFGFVGQPIAHTEWIWNFLGMFVAGWGSVLLGGCPLRQMIMSAEGNIDSVITVMGLLVGGAISHNFALASTVKGATSGGKIAVIVCICLLGAVSYSFIEKKKNHRVEGDVKLNA